MRGAYVYKHSDLRPWDPRTDLFQYEHNYVIATKTRHKAPMIRTASIVSVDPKCDVNVSLGPLCFVFGLSIHCYDLQFEENVYIFYCLVQLFIRYTDVGFSMHI